MNNKQFIPDTRNLGGKRNVDQQSRSHLLALINIKPTINVKKQPHKHVNAGHQSQKKNLTHYDEFKEVHEAFRRVNEMKKGGIDQSRPITMKRHHMISRRIPQAKDIGMQDHQRNVRSLITRLDGVEKQHEKKVEQIRNISVNTTAHGINNNKSYRSINTSMARKGSINNISNNNNNLSNNNKAYNSQQQFYPKKKNSNNNILNDISYQQHQQNTNQSEHNTVMDFSEAHQFEDQVGNQEEYEDDDDYNDYENNNQNKQFNKYSMENQGKGVEESQFEQHRKYKDQLHKKDNKQFEQKLNDISSYTPHSNSIRDMSYYSTTSVLNNSQRNPNSRPQSALVRSANQYNIPFINKKSGGDPYRELRRVLLNIVMDNNLYDKKIITVDLPSQAKKANPHLQKQAINDICNGICLNLYGQI